MRDFDEDKVQSKEHILHLLPDGCVLDFRDTIFRMEHCMSTYIPFGNLSSHDLRLGFPSMEQPDLGRLAILERMVRIMNGICIGENWRGLFLLLQYLTTLYILRRKI